MFLPNLWPSTFGGSSPLTSLSDIPFCPRTVYGSLSAKILKKQYPQEKLELHIAKRRKTNISAPRIARRSEQALVESEKDDRKEDTNITTVAMGDNDTSNWTFPLSKMKGMTEARYSALVAQAKNPNLPQRCAAIISGFTCIGKTYFGTQWRPTYGNHRVINLEFNQYRVCSRHDNGGGNNNNNNSSSGGSSSSNPVDNEAYLNDTLIAAKFIPGAIVVVNCHVPFRKTMRQHGLDYVRVYPDFGNAAVKEAWRMRVLNRGNQQRHVASNFGGSSSNNNAAAAAAAAAEKFADRMMSCWDEWSEMGKSHNWEVSSPSDCNRVVVFGKDDYLSLQVEKILEVAAVTRATTTTIIGSTTNNNKKRKQQAQVQQLCTALISGFPAIGKSTLTKSIMTGALPPPPPCHLHPPPPGPGPRSQHPPDDDRGINNGFSFSSSPEDQHQNNPLSRDGFQVYDLDSSDFKIHNNSNSSSSTADASSVQQDSPWLEAYLAAITRHVQRENAIVLVSGHREVRQRLHDAGMRYIRVLPGRDLALKRHWIERDRARGGKLSAYLDENWDRVVGEMHDGFEGEEALKVVMGRECYLSGHLQELLDLCSEERYSDQDWPFSGSCGQRCRFSK